MKEIKTRNKVVVIVSVVLILILSVLLFTQYQQNNELDRVNNDLNNTNNMLNNEVLKVTNSNTKLNRSVELLQEELDVIEVMINETGDVLLLYEEYENSLLNVLQSCDISLSLSTDEAGYLWNSYVTDYNEHQLFKRTIDKELTEYIETMERFGAQRMTIIEEYNLLQTEQKE